MSSEGEEAYPPDPVSPVVPSALQPSALWAFLPIDHPRVSAFFTLPLPPLWASNVHS